MGTSLLNALYATDTGGGDTNKTVSFKVYLITCVDKKSPHKNETITKGTLDLEKLKKLLAFFFHLVARSFSSSLILTNPLFFLLLVFCCSVFIFVLTPLSLSFWKSLKGCPDSKP